MQHYSVQSLLDWLSSRGLIEKPHQAEAAILCHENVTQLPVYVHILMGLGALLSCLAFIPFLLATNIISLNDEESLLICGLCSIGLAITFHTLMKHCKPMLHSFMMQTSLLLILLGKVLFVVGFSEYISKVSSINYDWMISLSILLISLATYFVFPLYLDRFFSSLALLLSLLNNIYLQFDSNVPLFIYYGFLILLSAFLLQWKNKHYTWDPIVKASIITLCLSIVISMPYLTAKQITPGSFWIPLWAFNLVTGTALLVVCTSIAGLKKIKQLPFVLIAAGIVVLTAFSTPGIMLAIIFLLLGHDKHDRFLTTFGIISFCLFLIEYYYSLNLSLYYKSGVLFVNGLILLASYYMIKYFKWDQLK